MRNLIGGLMILAGIILVLLAISLFILPGVVGYFLVWWGVEVVE